MPVDIADLTEAAVIKAIDLSHISFRCSPALRVIQKESLNIAVIMPDLSFEAILLRLQMLRSSRNESTSGHVKAGHDVFMGTIVTTNKASEISEIVNALRFSVLH